MAETTAVPSVRRPTAAEARSASVRVAPVVLTSSTTMVRTADLPDVVQQSGHQQGRTQHRIDLEPRRLTDRLDQVAIHRVLVQRIALGTAADGGPGRYPPLDEAGLVELFPDLDQPVPRAEQGDQQVGRRRGPRRGQAGRVVAQIVQGHR